MCGKKGHFARDCWSRANHDKIVNEFDVENVNAEPGNEFVFTVESEINDVNLSQDGCAEREDGLVMIDSGASVTVCPKWFGNSKLEQSDVATCLRGTNGKPLQEYGMRQICGQTKRYDFHVVNVTKPILSVSCLCEHGVETHQAKKSFLRFGDGHEPLIKKGGGYFVKAHTVNAVEDMTRDKSQERCVRADGSENSCAQADGSKNSCGRERGAILEPSCHLLVFNLCIQTLEHRCLIISQRSRRSEAGYFASPVSLCVSCTGAPLRDTRTKAYFFLSPTTTELASAGIECRAPTSGPPPDPLVFLRP